MIGLEKSRTLAAAACPAGLHLGAEVRELGAGWYFPVAADNGVVVAGCNGIIINKQSGRPFLLGSAPSGRAGSCRI